jgi:alpha-1,3-rhamnosyl/mannosyltransferase
LPSFAAGVSRYVTGLVQGLATIDGRHEYFIFSKAKDCRSFVALPENFHVVSLPNFRRPGRLLYQHAVAGIHARRLKMDVWHGTHYGVPKFSVRLPLVSTFHDLSFIEFSKLFPAGKRAYFHYALMDATQRAAAIVCVSEATRAALQRHFPVNGRAVTIHSGVAPIFFKRLTSEELERVRGLRNVPSPYVLFVGTTERHKNLPLALRALARLRQRSGVAMQMVVAGLPGSGWREARTLIHSLGLSGHVQNLGYVAERDLPALYQGARLLILPSLVEGFGFPLLEAMAGGVPVLAALSANDHGGAPAELVSHPRMLCEQDVEQWALKMEALLFDEPLRCELSDFAARRATHFSWQTTAQRMIEVYESVAARRALSATPGGNGVLPMAVAASPVKKNGVAHHHPQQEASPAVMQAVLRTLIYADLFDYPLLKEEVHLGLLECEAPAEEVAAALENLRRLDLIERTGEPTVSAWWHLTGHRGVVALRDRRRQLTRDLWRRHAWLLRLICRFPFVKGVAISGAGAFENCTTNDDIDLFIIAETRRLWTTYAALVALLKLFGKRRMICLNYLIGHHHLLISPERDRDFFVAHQIAFLRPLKGRGIFQKFFSDNEWIHQYLPQTAVQRPAPLLGLPSAGDKSPWISRAVESFLGLRLFNMTENVIYRWYSRHILRLANQLDASDVKVNSWEIKLFTNNHRPGLLQRLEARYQEMWPGQLTNSVVNEACETFPFRNL